MSLKPEYQSYEEFQNRTKKLLELRQGGIEPYPHSFSTTGHSQLLLNQYENNPVGHSEDAAKGTTQEFTLAGRLVLFRGMGKNAFGHIQDESGRFQIMFNSELTQLEGFDAASAGTSAFKFIEKKLDLGDIIGVEGHLFRTMKGELTLFAKKVTLLCKTLLPLADKHSGLSDKEMRYRKRWLDLISNADVRNVFITRSRILKLVRQHLEDEQFMEVETPIVQSTYGGAEARPFKTVLNALDQEMFLRISLEISLKKLMVGGMHRIFEIGKVFRNEGIDRTHNPEFTLMEAYAAYWDYNDMMHLVETLFEKIALALYGKTSVPVAIPSGEIIEIEMKAPWVRMTMKESIKHYGGFDVDALKDDEMRKILIEKGDGDPLVLKNRPRGLLIAALFEAFVEEKLIQPHHITDHPVETTPLCKPHRDPEQRKQGIVERFESFVVGQEVCNSYTELNDPELQRHLLEEQAKKRDLGDEETPPIDEDFIEALCQGMPPTGGVGIGIDRLVMLFTGGQSIRDVLYFPWMKPSESAVKEVSEKV